MVALMLLLALAGQEPAAEAAAMSEAVSPFVMREASRWIRRPSAEDMAKRYPRKAAAAGLDGKVTMVCKIAASGEMHDCVIADETPPEHGFGDATLRLAPFFRMSLGKGEGSAREGGTMRIPIVWRLPH